MAQAEICMELTLWNKGALLGRLNLVLAPQRFEIDWYEKEAGPSVGLTNVACW
jgi:hypothetical protein